VRLKKLIRIVISVGAALVVLAASTILIMRGMGYFLVVRDPLKTADAVAVLSGGGPERVEYASQLVTEKYGRKLILTETGEMDPTTGSKVSTTMSKQAAEDGVKRGQHFFAGKHVDSTLDEARAVLKLAQTRNWKSIIVVTDTFHSRRTKLLFNDVFKDSDIAVRINPVDLPGYWYQPSSWWTTPAGRRATINEYLSLGWYYLGMY
jgi:uncharacterized SAM-binding protein YcdF (DUF218 family)